MTDINRVFMIGRLTKEPDLRSTQGGTSVASFSIANNKLSKKQRDAEYTNVPSFFNCVAWGKTGEIIYQHTHKGSKLAIEGRLQQRSWKDQSEQTRSVVEIVVENFQFLDAKQPTSSEPSGGIGQVIPADQVPESLHFSDDDIPF